MLAAAAQEINSKLGHTRFNQWVIRDFYIHIRKYHCGFVMSSTFILLIPCNISLHITKGLALHNELQQTHTNGNSGCFMGSRVLELFPGKMGHSLILYNVIHIKEALENNYILYTVDTFLYIKTQRLFFLFPLFILCLPQPFPNHLTC